MQHPRLVLALGVVASLAWGGTASAQKKPPRPCGISSIPMTVGNTWTYEPTEFPPPARGEESEKKKEIEAREAAQKLFPNQPLKIVVTVAGVETAKDGTTTVKLTEQIDERSIETTIVCTTSGMTASLDSFFYAGEPGGSYNLGFDKMERKGHTFPIVGGKIFGTEWHDDFKASWKRDATQGSQADLGAGSIELKRRMVMTADEPAIESPAGKWAKSIKLGIETTGKVLIDGGGEKGYEMPAGVTFLYVVEGVGLARVENSFFHAYQLTSFTVAPAK